MNTQNLRSNVLALGLALACVAPAARADLVVRVDCAKRALPSQATVAAALGIANLDQAYQARVRLASVMNRACRRADAGRVELVLQPAPAGGHAPSIQVASAAR